jgi:hypothetical protein
MPSNDEPTQPDADNRKTTVHFPPARPKLAGTPPSVIFFGAIDSSPGNWTSELTEYLSSTPCIILNPRCDVWDSTWREDVNFRPFKEQVEWELDHADMADFLVFYFKPGNKTQPITLLELGMHAARYPDRCSVCCLDGFYKKGNVEIVCQRLGVPCFANFDLFKEHLKDKLVQDLKLKNTSGGPGEPT